jgi:tryptophan synthase beta chain
VRDAYRLWRPTPLYRAHRLEAALDTPAKIFYKYEGTSPAGSHKPNTAVPQAYENAQAGIAKLSTETGAGSVGLGAGVCVHPVRARVRGLHGRLELRPEALPALDDAGVGRDRASLPVRRHRERARAVRAPDGSLGIAISEAVEVAAQDERCNYSLAPS